MFLLEIHGQCYVSCQSDGRYNIPTPVVKKMTDGTTIIKNVKRVEVLY